MFSSTGHGHERCVSKARVVQSAQIEGSLVASSCAGMRVLIVEDEFISPPTWRSNCAALSEMSVHPPQLPPLRLARPPKPPREATSLRLKVRGAETGRLSAAGLKLYRPPLPRTSGM